ncbi:MAG: chemotaxis protein CheW [Opitutales bacterium]|jgi:chemotaxis-related protein WspB
MLLVLFSLGDQRYGLDAAVVDLIVPALPVRAVPGTPPAVSGVHAFRGQVMPVIDLVQLTLGRPARPALGSRFIITRYPIGGSERYLALHAESVNEVRDVPDSSIHDSGVRSPGAPYLGPVAETPAGLVQIVTLRNLLPPDLQSLLFSDDIQTRNFPPPVAP